MAIEIVDFPMKNGGSFHSYVSLPEGNSKDHVTLIHLARKAGLMNPMSPWSPIESTAIQVAPSLPESERRHPAPAIWKKNGCQLAAIHPELSRTFSDHLWYALEAALSRWCFRFSFHIFKLNNHHFDEDNEARSLCFRAGGCMGEFPSPLANTKACTPQHINQIIKFNQENNLKTTDYIIMMFFSMIFLPEIHRFSSPLVGNLMATESLQNSFGQIGQLC